jgi:hypothetical protein
MTKQIVDFEIVEGAKSEKFDKITKILVQITCQLPYTKQPKA